MSRTITTSFLQTVSTHGDIPALRWKEGTTWPEMTWTEVADHVARFAGGLKEMGVKPGDKVVLLVGNRPEFHIADLATLFLRATPVSLYMSSSPAQIEELTQRLGAEVVITADNIGAVDGPGIDLRAANAAISTDDLATIIFTSGTTASPKGVKLTHANVVALVDGVRLATDVDLAGKRVVSYLPLAHIAERALSHYLPIFTAMTVTTCPDVGRLSSYLTATRPHLFFAVPRIWDKLRSGVEKNLRSKGHLGRLVRHLLDTNPVVWKMGEPLLRRVRIEIGLDQVIFAASGAAPISKETTEWISALGIPFSEIYGMSETTGPITWSPYGHELGTVGKALPGVEVRLLPDGEIVCRGNSIFSGYLDDESATTAALHDGWLCTGDIGEIDACGNVKIVDRKKDLIITAGGKNVSPAALEAKLETHSAIAHACIIGDRRSFISAVIELDTAESTSPDEIEQHVRTVNATLSQAEKIKRFVIVDDTWAPGSDVLTHTMKVRRRGVEAKYAQEIEAFYNRSATAA